jgi:hypothetical protein
MSLEYALGMPSVKTGAEHGILHHIVELRSIVLISGQLVTWPLSTLS